MTIYELFAKFPTHEHCIMHLEEVRWDGVPTCTHCGSQKYTLINEKKGKTRRYHCNSCNKAYSVLAGSIFENTKLSLLKWFHAISMMLNAKKGISAKQLQRELKVSYKTAWSLAHRIREAMFQEQANFEGIVEADETFVGRQKKKNSREGQQIVFGFVERRGEARAYVVPDRSFETLTTTIIPHANLGESKLYTDKWASYPRIGSLFTNHKTIKRKEKNRRCPINTNSIEGFWPAIKRGIYGQWHNISRAYMQRYIDEAVYRYNVRKEDSETAFNKTIRRALSTPLSKHEVKRQG